MIIVWILFVFISVWLIFVSYSFLKLKRHYDTLVEGVNKKTLEGVLTTMVKDIHEAKKGIAYLSSRCDTIEKNQLFHIQQIGLLRFNPFKDTGGDQSLFWHYWMQMKQESLLQHY